ncbi:ubiquitin-conjugating enzyme E2 34-like [Chlorella sorokiniana]|uniref:E2 ubiquitin-conjugating enzyme n=2 Tax=Viridiplantae TaxID=33090 RepID=A0A2P6TZ64_CHLSO|nr:ubiquitin-conjugating enzyme E2 34-like [Chlorella sorokiniana]|eukprot:PRW59362.1 ubiquitin-conjugating enzyme E2 34-like [Chlorella sorokiniana]
MGSKACVSRLQKEYKAILKEPVPQITAHPAPNNLLEWHYVLEGSKATDFEGGCYHGKVIFPAQYPYKPPSILMLTPNGRFAVNTKLCLSMSDFHPETWNPMWSVSTILTGLLSFMVETQHTTGAISTSAAEKRKLARESLAYNVRNPTFRKLFPEWVKEHEEALKAAQQQQAQAQQQQQQPDGQQPDGAAATASLRVENVACVELKQLLCKVPAGGANATMQQAARARTQDKHPGAALFATALPQAAAAMGSKACVSRLQKEYKAILKEPVPQITAHPAPNNLLEWHYVLEGSKATDFEGGCYHGKVIFPAQYPYKPPSILMLTPNGRFAVNTKLCLSMSDFHPETWNPMWSVSTILTGLLSFMVETQHTTGAISTSAAEKRKLARESLAYNVRNPTFRKLFPEWVKEHEEALKAAQQQQAQAQQQQQQPDGQQPDGAAAAPGPAPGAGAGAAVDSSADPCACTQTGLSGGQNTSRIGCGQWDVVSGSNRFTCFVNDPARCTQGVALGASAEFPGAATKECTAEEAQPNLPSISKLIVSTPQLVSFANALRQANLSSIPGEQVTIFAPSNQAFNAAVFSGIVTREQLQDPTFLRGLVLASIVPQRLTTSDLASAGSLTAADGQQLPVKAQSGGQTIVGRAGVVLPDIQATNGIIQITDGFVALPAGTTGLLAGSDLSSQLTGGCACTTNGMSGAVQTGQVGCAPRTDSNFLLPISLCYVQNPATCIASFQSTTYPGAAWKLC